MQMTEVMARSEDAWEAEKQVGKRVVEVYSALSAKVTFAAL